MPVVGDESHRSSRMEVSLDPEAILPRFVGPIGRRKHRFDAPRHHGCRLAWVRGRTTLTQAKGGQGAGNGLLKGWDSMTILSKICLNVGPCPKWRETFHMPIPSFGQQELKKLSEVLADYLSHRELGEIFAHLGIEERGGQPKWERMVLALS